MLPAVLSPPSFPSPGASPTRHSADRFWFQYRFFPPVDVSPRILPYIRQRLLPRRNHHRLHHRKDRPTELSGLGPRIFWTFSETPKKPTPCGRLREALPISIRHTFSKWLLEACWRGRPLDGGLGPSCPLSSLLPMWYLWLQRKRVTGSLEMWPQATLLASLVALPAPAATLMITVSRTATAWMLSGATRFPPADAQTRPGNRRHANNIVNRSKMPSSLSNCAAGKGQVYLMLTMLTLHVAASTILVVRMALLSVSLLAR
jgi:hypothetical protein